MSRARMTSRFYRLSVDIVVYIVGSWKSGAEAFARAGAGEDCWGRGEGGGGDVGVGCCGGEGWGGGCGWEGVRGGGYEGCESRVGGAEG